MKKYIYGILSIFAAYGIYLILSSFFIESDAMGFVSSGPSGNLVVYKSTYNLWMGVLLLIEILISDIVVFVINRVQVVKEITFPKFTRALVFKGLLLILIPVMILVIHWTLNDWFIFEIFTKAL